MWWTTTENTRGDPGFEKDHLERDNSRWPHRSPIRTVLYSAKVELAVMAFK